MVLGFCSPLQQWSSALYSSWSPEVIKEVLVTKLECVNQAQTLERTRTAVLGLKVGTLPGSP